MSGDLNQLRFDRITGECRECPEGMERSMLVQIYADDGNRGKLPNIFHRVG